MVGRTFSHYRIVAPLGAGGMGVVYRAEDVRLGREVALKFVSEDSAHDDHAMQRLRSEARAASALNHANICTIYDVGEDEGHPFIVMELMKGRTLRDRLVDGPLKVHHLVDIGIEISDALHATHSDGIIHRDIKPGNIFLTDRGHVKVLDFGLAKLTRTLGTSSTTNEVVHQTVAGVAIGTVSYMSPEQAAGEELDGRTDLFSLGVVLYECATGRHPFPGKTSAVILAAILNRAPAAPVTINPDLPLRLQEVINNCLEKDRELRYQSAADLRADLKRLRRDIESSHTQAVEATSRSHPGSSASGAGLDANSAGSAAASSSHASAPGAATSSRILRAGAVLAALAVLAGAYVFWPRTTTIPEAGGGTPVTAPPPGAAVDIALAQASLDARNYRAALAYAGAILAAEPDRADAARVRDEAQAMLARFEETIEQARADLARGDVSATARSLEAARDLDPSAPSVVEIGSRLADLVREREAAARERVSREAARPAPRPAEAAPPRVAQAPEPAPPPVVPPPAPTPSPVQVQPLPATGTAPSTTRSAQPVTPVPVEAPPPARVEPPKPVAPEPPPVPAETDETAIRNVVATYGRAIEQKDIALFRSIKPNLSSDEERRLMEGFRAVTSQQVALTVASIDRTDDNAVVVVNRRDVLDVRGRRQTVESRQTLALSRSSGRWVIEEIR